MNKIKYLMIALMAVILSVNLTACSDDDDNTKSNVERYQSEVEAAVKAQKKNNKAILLVAFGSTWQQAFDAFDQTVAAYKSAFPGYDVYLSFSSAICINRAAAGENAADGAEIRNYYAPNYWLEAFGRAGYEDITVQSLQVIPGEEYGRVVNFLKDFGNNVNNTLSNEYLKNVKLHLGTPLMATTDDVDALADALHANFSKYSSNGIVAFMGHGNPNEYDTYSANIRYTQLEEALQAKYGKNYYVGTVDMEDNFKTQVFARMQANGVQGNVYCAPLMSVAGDHAHNDMAGDDDEFNLNEENGEMEDTSWKVYFNAQDGFSCNDELEKDVVRGLLEYSNVRQLWINHTKTAVASEPLEYFHSNDGTE